MSDDDGVQLNDPQTLYRRWEDSQWSPFAVDLGTDREQWSEMDGGGRGLVLFVLSSLVVGGERTTTSSSGLGGPSGWEGEAPFPSPQQVDEPRHMQFYARFRD